MKTTAKRVKLIKTDDQLISQFFKEEILSPQSMRTIRGGDGADNGGVIIIIPPPPPPPSGGN